MEGRWAAPVDERAADLKIHVGMIRAIWPRIGCTIKESVDWRYDRYEKARAASARGDPHRRSACGHRYEAASLVANRRDVAVTGGLGGGVTQPIRGFEPVAKLRGIERASVSAGRCLDRSD